MGEKVQVAAKKPEVKRETPASHTRNADQSQSMGSPADQVLYLQRTIGNQAVQKLVRSGALQAKLKIGHPREKYDLEADRVADAVMRIPEPQLQRQPVEEEEEVVQTNLLSDEITLPIQRQEETDVEGGEEEVVQTKLITEQTSSLIQRQVEGEVEEEVVQPRSQTSTASSDPIRYVQRSVAWIQAKLKIGQPNDQYEQEADRVADAVMRMPEPKVVSRQAGNPSECPDCGPEELRSQPKEEEEEEQVQTKPVIEQITPLVQKQVEEEEQIQTKPVIEQITPLVQRQTEEEEELQTKTTTGRIPEVQPNIESHIQSLKGGGRPLSENDRAFFEPRFSRDFSQVRVHTDTQASETAKSINSKAFTVGNNIVFGRGQFEPDSNEGQRLMGHELTHVVQQTGGVAVLPHGLPAVQRLESKGIGEKNGSEPMSSHEGRQLITHNLNDVAQEGAANNTFSAARFTPAPMLQRVLYVQSEDFSHLILWIPFGNEHILHILSLEQDVSGFFDADSGLAQNVENELELIFNPPARALHETAAYLQSAAVFQLIVRGVRQLLTAGRTNFSELTDLLLHRTNLFYEQNLLPAATNYLADALGIDPAAINWNDLIPALRTQARNFEPTSIIDASLRDRYDMFLDMLGNEAGALPPVIGAAEIDHATADDHLFAYVTDQGSALFSEDVYAYHSEKFLEEYILLLEAIRYIPTGFDLESFRPVRDTSAIDARHETIIADFLEHEATGWVVMYILDHWTESGQSPEQFLGTLDLENFRVDMVTDLARELVERARGEPELMTALRSRAFDQARYTQVAAIYGYGQSLEQRNWALEDTFTTVPLDEVSAENYAIAADPYTYHKVNLDIASVLRDLLSSLSPNGPLELQVLQAGMDILQAQDIPAQYAGIFLLPELFGYFRALQNALEEQERETQRALEERLDLNWETIAETVRNQAEYADRFIREQWIPMLKQVAFEWLTANRDEIQAIYDNLDVANEEFIARLAAGADEFELLAQRLEEESYESIEMEDQTITRDDASYLRQAAQFMHDEASARMDSERLEQQRAELQEALDVYETVRADIENDEYDPLNYSREVYQDARQRLGISEFPEFTTVGMVITGGVTAAQNPFLARAIVGWHWREGVERQIETGLLLGGLLIFSVAGMLVPGVGGLILAIIDIGIGVGMGVHQIANAYELLNMARLDIHRDIRGVSVEEAERALRHAWIGLGVTVVLTAGPMVLARALRVRGGGIELPPAVRRWEEGLSDSTQQLFRRDPALRRRFATMSPTSRRLLTHCSRLCVPPGLTDGDVLRIEELAARMERDTRGYTIADEWMLREYFYARQNRISAAIDGVEGATNLDQLRSFLRQAASQRALSVPVPDSPVGPSGYPGTWGNIRPRDSDPNYGHSVIEHGPQLKAWRLADRARDPQRNKDVGQWYDNSFIIEAEQRATAATIIETKANGRTVHEFDMGRPVGRVFTPTGTIVSDVTRVRVIRLPNGSVRTSTPIR